ncbi:MAG: FAD-binding oxidoreductase [Psychroserpens sp.]|nr:FAD-binding oxidoreductase [Psychroserpens sp.]
MNLSYWEIKSWLSNIDFTVVGSGIVGLSCALHLRKRFPKAKILVLEKGHLPQGASTKNAGFACFGSLSEIIDDLKSHSEEEVFRLVNQRIDGLRVLRETLGDKAIDYQELGGYELFSRNSDLMAQCVAQKKDINRLLQPLFSDHVFSFKPNNFGFKDCEDQIGFNQFEGQIDTGKMMNALIDKAHQNDIRILNNITVEQFSEEMDSVKIKTDQFEFTTSKLCIATNGFASALGIEKVKPARAQVLITKPIQNLKIKGTFHLDQGYYYFRNIDNRILFGGGRNLDFKGEETTVFDETKLIQNQLESLLSSTILPDQTFEIEHRWSGIMGVGQQKKPIVKALSNHVFCGVRLGGMGVAIGSSVGKDLAELL